MSDAILVRGFDSARGKIACRAAAVLLVGAGAVFYFGMELPPLAIIAVAAGGVLWVATDFYSLRSNRRKRWITDTGDGFIVADGAGQRPYRDDQLASIAISDTEKYSGGVRKSTRRRVLLWMEGESGLIELDFVVRAGTSDPIAPLVDRWLDNLKTRARTAMAQGGALHGDGWSLRSSGLSITSETTTAEVPVDQIAETGLFGGKFCLWRRGEEQASLQLDPDGRNVPVLMALVEELLEARQESSGGAEASDRQPVPAVEPGGTGLGRVLFERRSQGLTIAAAVAATICGALGVVMVTSPEVFALGVGLLILAGLFALGAWRAPSSVFRCHAQGVFQSGPTGKRQLRYDEVDTFTYSAVRQYVNGAYTGTTLALKLTAPGTTIDYNKSVKNVDEDLDNLRDHIASVIASRMGEQLSREEPVVWTKNLTLRPDGIEFAPQGFLGRKERQFLPYKEVSGFNLHEGVFHLWAGDEKKSVMQEQVSAPNFFPGFLLLCSIFKPPEDQ